MTDFSIPPDQRPPINPPQPQPVAPVQSTFDVPPVEGVQEDQTDSANGTDVTG